MSTFKNRVISQFKTLPFYHFLRTFEGGVTRQKLTIQVPEFLLLVSFDGRNHNLVVSREKEKDFFLSLNASNLFLPFAAMTPEEIGRSVGIYEKEFGKIGPTNQVPSLWIEQYFLHGVCYIPRKNTNSRTKVSLFKDDIQKRAGDSFVTNKDVISFKRSDNSLDPIDTISVSFNNFGKVTQAYFDILENGEKSEIPLPVDYCRMLTRDELFARFSIATQKEYDPVLLFRLLVPIEMSVGTIPEKDLEKVVPRLFSCWVNGNYPILYHKEHFHGSVLLLQSQGEIRILDERTRVDTQSHLAKFLGEVLLSGDFPQKPWKIDKEGVSLGRER